MSEGFLSRWSKRKQEVAREEASRPGAERQDATELRSEASLDGEGRSQTQPHPDGGDDPDSITPEELAALPPLEEVTDPAGFAPYLRKGVPLLLRNAAMRRMWMLNPVIRDYVDPAVDYAFDWNTPGGVLGNGPLEAGFDAKAAAERVFSRMRGRISFETGDWEEQLPSDRDTLSQVSVEEVDVQEVAASQQNPQGPELADKNPVKEPQKTGAVPATLVVNDDVAPPNKSSGMQVEQGPARRHGRALPV
jgi:hypothetical protein